MEWEGGGKRIHFFEDSHRKKIIFWNNVHPFLKVRPIPRLTAFSPLCIGASSMGMSVLSYLWSLNRSSVSHCMALSKALTARVRLERISNCLMLTPMSGAGLTSKSPHLGFY